MAGAQAESFGAQQYSFFGALGNDGGLGGSLDGSIEDGLGDCLDDEDEGLFDGPDALEEPELDLIADDAEDLSMLGFASSSAAAAPPPPANHMQHNQQQQQQQNDQMGQQAYNKAPPSMLGAMTLSELEAATQAVSVQDPYTTQQHQQQQAMLQQQQLQLLQQQQQLHQQQQLYQQQQQQPFLASPHPSPAPQPRPVHPHPPAPFGFPAVPIDSNALEAMMLGEADNGSHFSMFSTQPQLSIAPPRPGPLPPGTSHPLSHQQQHQHQQEQYRLLQAFPPQQQGQPGHMQQQQQGQAPPGGFMGFVGTAPSSPYPPPSQQQPGTWGHSMTSLPFTSASQEGPRPGPPLQQQGQHPLPPSTPPFPQQGFMQAQFFLGAPGQGPAGAHQRHGSPYPPVFPPGSAPGSFGSSVSVRDSREQMAAANPMGPPSTPDQLRHPGLSHHNPQQLQGQFSAQSPQHQLYPSPSSHPHSITQPQQQQQQHGMEGEQSSSMHLPIRPFAGPGGPPPPPPPAQPFPHQAQQPQPDGRFQNHQVRSGGGASPARNSNPSSSHPPPPSQQQQLQHGPAPLGPSPPPPRPTQVAHLAVLGRGHRVRGMRKVKRWGQVAAAAAAEAGWVPTTRGLRLPPKGRACGAGVGPRPRARPSPAVKAAAAAAGTAAPQRASDRGMGRSSTSSRGGRGGPGSSYPAEQQRGPHQVAHQGRGHREGSVTGSHTGGRGGGAEWSIRKSAGWMSGAEIDGVMSSLLYGISSGEPYVEDYYYQAFVNKHARAVNARGFAPAALRDFTRELAHLDPSASAQFVRVEGLGKIVYGNLRAPRVLMDLTGGGGGAPRPTSTQAKELTTAASSASDAAARAGRRLNQDPHFAARILIEDCLNLLLDVDDIDRTTLSFAARMGYHYVNHPDAAELLRRRGVLLSGIASSFRLPPTPHALPAPRDDPTADAAGRSSSSPATVQHSDGVFLRIMTLVKGRDLLARVLRVLRPAPLLTPGDDFTSPPSNPNPDSATAPPAQRDAPTAPGAHRGRQHSEISTLEQSRSGGEGSQAQSATRAPGAVLLAEGCDPVHVLWATLRGACHLFGASLQSAGADAAGEATLTDTSVRVARGALVALSRLETQRQLCDCLAAFVGGCRRHEAALAPGEASPLEVALLPLALARSSSAPPPPPHRLTRNRGVSIQPPASSEWLGEILAALLDRASQLGLGEDMDGIPEPEGAAPGGADGREVMAAAAARTGPMHAEWRVWCDALFALLVRHLEALHSIREAAWGGRERRGRARRAGAGVPAADDLPAAARDARAASAAHHTHAAVLGLGCGCAGRDGSGM
ncbi:MAG: hypothetical protein WDW36_000476 [Sanguina aurantia]